MTTQNPSSTMTLSHRREAEIYLSEDCASILHVLSDGTTMRLARSRYELLLGKCRSGDKPRLTLKGFITGLYWVIRFAALIATMYNLRR